MEHKWTSREFLAAVLLASSIAGVAYAKGQDENRKLTALQDSKITLADAMKTAEQQTGGRAYEASLELKGGQPRIMVETNGPTGVQTVAIDTQSGQIVNSYAGSSDD